MPDLKLLLVWCTAQFHHCCGWWILLGGSGQWLWWHMAHHSTLHVAGVTTGTSPLPSYQYHWHGSFEGLQGESLIFSCKNWPEQTSSWWLFVQCAWKITIIGSKEWVCMVFFCLGHSLNVSIWVCVVILSGILIPSARSLCSKQMGWRDSPTADATRVTAASPVATQAHLWDSRSTPHSRTSCWAFVSKPHTSSGDRC